MEFLITVDTEYASSMESKGEQIIQILDLLENHNQKAIFFIEGRWASSNFELVKLIDSKGHLIGNHTYHHAPAINLNLIGLYREIRSTHEILKQLDNYKRKLLRLPYGSGAKNIRVRFFLFLLRYKHIGWEIDSYDWRDNSEKVYSNIEIQMHHIKNKRRTQKILFHSWPNSTLKGLAFTLQLIDTQNAK